MEHTWDVLYDVTKAIDPTSNIIPRLLKMLKNRKMRRETTSGEMAMNCETATGSWLPWRSGCLNTGAERRSELNTRKLGIIFQKTFIDVKIVI